MKNIEIVSRVVKAMGREMPEGEQREAYEALSTLIEKHGVQGVAAATMTAATIVAIGGPETAMRFAESVAGTLPLVLDVMEEAEQHVSRV